MTTGHNICAIDGCDTPSRNKTAEWCAKHYMRWYKHGSPHLTVRESGIRSGGPGDYRVVHLPSHPLARADGNVLEHRAVLFDAIGPGVHQCHWCGTAVAWEPDDEASVLWVEHLDSDKSNNARENLAPSCIGCNAGRALHHRAEVIRATGYWQGPHATRRRRAK